MSEIKPVSIKTWQEHLTNVFYSDSDETQCRDKEVAELRAALEASQNEVMNLASQEARLQAELEEKKNLTRKN
jgi:ribosomal protein L29